MCVQVVGSLPGCGEGEVSSHCACSLISPVSVSEPWNPLKSCQCWKKLHSNEHETDQTDHSEEQKSIYNSQNRKGFG